MKLNNNGFTLIELLGVIVLLAVVTTIAVPSVLGISRKLKQNMLETKIDLILEDAKLYGQDNISQISGSSKLIDILEERADGTKVLNSYPCASLQISQIIHAGYIEADEGETKLINPVTNQANLQNEYVIFYCKNRRVVTIMQDSNLDGTQDYSCN